VWRWIWRGPVRGIEYLLLHKIAFDAEKRAKTFEERGLDFADAAHVFLGKHITLEVDRQDYGEPRFIPIGWLADRRVMLAWTPREDTRRIINMRKCNDREIARDQKHISL
jgi:uncharacterized protein